MPADHDEGSEEGRRFKSLLGRILRVSKDELKQREAQYRKERAARKHATSLPPRARSRRP